MPRKDPETGKFIITAGEVGSYAVCPESWRLQYVKKVEYQTTDEMKKGDALHGDWVMRYERAHSLAWQAKLTILLILLAIVIVVIIVKR